MPWNSTEEPVAEQTSKWERVGFFSLSFAICLSGSVLIFISVKDFCWMNISTQVISVNISDNQFCFKERCRRKFVHGIILRQLLLDLAENSRRMGGMGGIGLPIIRMEGSRERRRRELSQKSITILLLLLQTSSGSITLSKVYRFQNQNISTHLQQMNKK